MQRKVRGLCLFMIPILIGAAVTVSGIQSRTVYWSCIALSTGLAVVVLVSFLWKSLEIHEAIYGSEFGGQDVTDVVRRQIHDGRASFIVGSDLFGDPRRDVFKRLTVNFSFQGKRQTKIVQQDHWCNLP
jgi:hypothetical protein